MYCKNHNKNNNSRWAEVRWCTCRNVREALWSWHSAKHASAWSCSADTHKQNTNTHTQTNKQTFQPWKSVVSLKHTDAPHPLNRVYHLRSITFYPGQGPDPDSGFGPDPAADPGAGGGGPYLPLPTPLETSPAREPYDETWNVHIGLGLGLALLKYWDTLQQTKDG